MLSIINIYYKKLQLQPKEAILFDNQSREEKEFELV
jgi:hypothetical protein